jgi:redox-sensitive bicupin YhaK (pirin superfamily)
VPGGVERHDQSSAMINSADAAAARGEPSGTDWHPDRGFELVGSGGNFHGIQLWVNLPGIRSSSEPVVHYAPFVMNSKSSVIQAVEDFQAGKFGNIPPDALMPPTTGR